MRLIPEVLPLLRLRTWKLTLLTSIVCSAVLALFSAPLAAQTTRDLPKTIPDLSAYDAETRRTIEIVCISEKMNGPVVYGTRLVLLLIGFALAWSAVPLATPAPPRR